MRDTGVGHILSNWENHHPDVFGRHALKLEHTLSQSHLFSDAALVGLLENAPRENYHVTTMGKGGNNPRYKREGQFGNLTGAEILHAVKQGSIWINFQSPQQIQSAYGDLLADIYREFETRIPGLKTYRHKMTILISSPRLKVKYHFDLPGQTLWQIRGQKRVYVYPAEPPFLSQQALEKVAINEAHETDLPYHDWFDDHAQIYDLQPGEMLHWPLNRPHRIENHDCLNVSLTTEHWTTALRNQYAVNYGNAILRKLGGGRLSQSTGPVNLYPKAAVAAVVKGSGLQQRRKKPFIIDFEVDPTAPDCIRNIEPFEYRK